MVRYRYAKRPNLGVIPKFLLFIPRVIAGTIFAAFSFFGSIARKLFHKTRRQGPSFGKVSFDYRYGLILVVPVVLFLAFNSSIFKVKKVDISWNDPNFTVSSVDAVYRSGTLSKNIFLVSGQSLLKMAKDAPVVSDVSLSKKYPSGLLIAVKTREPFAEGLWFNPENEASTSSLIARDFFGSITRQASRSAESYLLDKDGLVFWKNSKPWPGFPVFFFVDGSTPVLGEKVSGNQNKAGLVFVNDLLGKENASAFPKLLFIVSDREQLLAKFDGGPYVFLPQQSSYIDLLDSLKLILDKYHIEGKVLKKVDLRFNNPVVEY